MISVPPTLDSVPLFYLVAEHLYAVELSRAAQVSKTLRAASDSDESWTVSYGVSKAQRKQMVDSDKAEVELLAEEHRQALISLRAAKENVSTLTNKLAEGIIVVQYNPVAEMSLRYTGYDGVYETKNSAALSWEMCPSTSLMYHHSQIADLRVVTRIEEICRSRVRILVSKLQLNMASLSRPPWNP